MRDVKVRKIEDDTPLMPWVVADCVIRELEMYLYPKGDQGLRGPSASHDLADVLADKANTVYQRNPRFREWMRGKHGRDYLYTFMRHWLSAEVKDRFGIRVPESFANGWELRREIAELEAGDA